MAALVPGRHPSVLSNGPWLVLHRTDCGLRRPFQSGKALSGSRAHKDTTITVAAVFDARKWGKPASEPCPRDVVGARSAAADAPTAGRRDSAGARDFLALRDFRESARIGIYGFGDGPAKDKVPFAAAGDQSGLAQNLEMVGDCRGSYAAHRNDFAASHVFGHGNGLKNSEPRPIRQGLRYFFDVGTIHGFSHR
jgi:hypothetical protein